MRKFWLLSLGLGMIGLQTVKAQQVIELYPGAIPGAKAAPASYKEIQTVKDGKVTGLSKVFHPTVTLYQPAAGKANGTAVIICPGGGYQHLAIGHEGDEVAKRFIESGVAAIVLKYRLPDDTTMVDKSFGPLQDAEQAIYLVRKNAAKWNINPAKVGIMGFSAGGHLASSLTVHYRDSKIENKEKLSLRPDFAILIYPVISFTAPTHAGSVKSLIGDNGTPEQKEYFSNEKHVDAQTPITFLVHANDDNAVPVENSILFDQALVKNKVAGEMHLYQGGGHGFGLHNKTTKDDWFERLQNWMTANKL
ncbi:Acetyl esterase/lipase [Pedobacter westerhofensis]|uniref:Acetyl esterase/lipase n=1 Tax=Pedobacter westerhofensis TaxID=425512 RepID=A0A521EG35_9SPHI|nr:alpha/beta hydrolase [Pedobacter westerhofensis]SMO82848.1 Acetyl esterase/lipase [Pedobacter westerhofensis]